MSSVKPVSDNFPAYIDGVRNFWNFDDISGR